MSSYAIGDKVRATKTLFEAATGDIPAQDFCDRGDLLEVRHVGGFWPYSVAHPEMSPGVMFGVNAEEIEPA